MLSLSVQVQVYYIDRLRCFGFVLFISRTKLLEKYSIFPEMSTLCRLGTTREGLDNRSLIDLDIIDGFNQ